MHQRGRLAGARAGHDQQRPIAVRSRLALLRVQTGQQVVNRRSLCCHGAVLCRRKAIIGDSRATGKALRFQECGRVLVSVHSLDGNWSIFRREIAFGAKTSAENMDLSPFAATCEVLSAAKIGTVPCEPNTI